MGKHVNTVCARDCYDTCVLTVTTDADGHPVRMTGSPDDPITRGIQCPRAAGDLKRLIRNRVHVPHIRDGERLVPATWDEALTRVSRKLIDTLEQYGPASTLYLDYAGHMGLSTSQFSKRFWHAIGATMTDGAICSTSGKVGIRLHYGETYGINPANTGAFPLIVFWGFNAAVSAPHLWQLALEARKRRGAVIVVIDPIRTRTAARADHWVRPNPGTDVALAYGIIRELMHAGAADADFIRTRTTGFDTLAAEAKNWRPERVHEITGVSPDTVKRLCVLYDDIRPSATMIGLGLQKCVCGADQVRAVSLIPAVLGMNRGFFYSSSDAHEVDSDRISGRSLTRTPGETVSHVALGDLLEQRRFRYVHISGHNPAVTLPNQKAIRRGLRAPEVFITVQETHWTRSAEMADVVLPALTYLEKTDLVIPWSHNRICWSPPVVPVQTDGRPEHDISGRRHSQSPGPGTFRRRHGTTGRRRIGSPQVETIEPLRDAVRKNRICLQPGGGHGCFTHPRSAGTSGAWRVDIHPERHCQLYPQPVYRSVRPDSCGHRTAPGGCRKNGDRGRRNGGG